MRYVYPVVFMPSKDGEHYDGGYYAECVDIPIAAGGSNYKRAKKKMQNMLSPDGYVVLRTTAPLFLRPL